MYNLTAADFADTGQWRMTLNIRYDGLDARLENMIRPEIPPQKLCEISWSGDKKDLLKHLVEAVYNTPRLLDDFATRIILFDPHTLFVPTVIAEENSNSEAELYNNIYEANSRDIMWETWKNVTAIWSMAPGIREFLLRTFPGARISCNLMMRVKESSIENGQWLLRAHIRGKEVDIVLMDNARLMAASTKNLESRDEVKKLIPQILEAYGRSAANTIVDITDEAGNNQES